MKQWMELFQKEVPVRFTRKQKRKTLDLLSEQLETLGYECEKTKHRKYFTSVENLIAGNLKQAKNVICVPYDTQSRVYWPKFLYYPLDGNRSAGKSMLPLYVPVFILYFLMLATIYGGPYFFTSPAVLMTTYGFGLLMFVLLIVMLVKGFPSQKNTVCNTTAIAAAMKVASSLDKEDRKKTAFVFLDQNNGRHYGAMFFRNQLAQLKKSSQTIALNCIGAGGEIVVGYPKGQKKLAQELVKAAGKNAHVMTKGLDQPMCMQSMMEHLNKGVVVTTGTFDKEHNLYIDTLRRNRDTTFDEAQLETIVSMLHKYLNA